MTCARKYTSYRLVYIAELIKTGLWHWPVYIQISRVHMLRDYFLKLIKYSMLCSCSGSLFWNIKIVDSVNTLPFRPRKIELPLKLLSETLMPIKHNSMTWCPTDRKNKRWFLSTYFMRDMRAELVLKKICNFKTLLQSQSYPTLTRLDFYW